MIIIADTSPVNYLILIGAISVLPELYHNILVPNAVFEELQADGTPEKVRDWIRNPPSWLKVERVTVLPAPDLSELDKGEQEAIALVEELNADALIIDDRAGRIVARKRGIFVIGTLGVLNSAAAQDLLDLPDALDKLKKTSFRASEGLISSLIELDAERKRRELS